MTDLTPSAGKSLEKLSDQCECLVSCSSCELIMNTSDCANGRCSHCGTIVSQLSHTSDYLMPINDLTFSYINDSRVELAVKAERERCATVARDRHIFWHSKPAEHGVSCDVTACEDIANEIMKGDA